MKITYSQIKALRPCWSESDLAAKLPSDNSEVKLTLENILSLSKSDRGWLVSNLMNRQQIIVWVKTCTKRAKKYLNNAAAEAAVYANKAYADAAAYATYVSEVAFAADSAAAAYATYTAAYTAAAAAYTAAAADDAYTAKDKEHKIAIKHALSLLNGKGICKLAK